MFFVFGQGYIVVPFLLWWSFPWKHSKTYKHICVYVIALRLSHPKWRTPTVSWILMSQAVASVVCWVICCVLCCEMLYARGRGWSGFSRWRRLFSHVLLQSYLQVPKLQRGLEVHACRLSWLEPGVPLNPLVYHDFTSADAVFVCFWLFLYVFVGNTVYLQTRQIWLL